MKTKIILLIGAVALITFSFTVSKSETTLQAKQEMSTAITSGPVGGFVADEMRK